MKFPSIILNVPPRANTAKNISPWTLFVQKWCWKLFLLQITPQAWFSLPFSSSFLPLQGSHLSLSRFWNYNRHDAITFIIGEIFSHSKNHPRVNKGILNFKVWLLLNFSTYKILNWWKQDESNFKFKVKSILNSNMANGGKIKFYASSAKRVNRIFHELSYV